jgi:formate/nitrite transporter FocA (FNT family)
MSNRDTLIRAYMAGAILALAAAFAVTINVQTGQPLAGAVFFRWVSACCTCLDLTC